MKEAEARAGRTVPPPSATGLSRPARPRHPVPAAGERSEGPRRHRDAAGDHRPDRPDQAAVPERGRVPEGADQAPHDDGPAQEEQRRDRWNAKTIEAEAAPRLAVTEQELDAFYKGNPTSSRSRRRCGRATSCSAWRRTRRRRPSRRRGPRPRALKRVKAGEDFAALAKQYSKDPLGRGRRRPELLPEGPDGAGVRRRRLRAQAR